jgi:kynurenine formamidase
VRLIDLSHTIVSGMAQYPGDDPPVRVVQRPATGAEGPVSSALELGCHVGTHVDTPLHFRRGRPGLEQLPLDRFCGRAQVVDAPAGDRPGAIAAELLRAVPLAELDFVILRTGWEERWGTARYYETWPYLSEESARVLARAQLKGIGIDSPSIDAYAAHTAHDICAAADLINVENLTNLAALPDGPFTLVVFPLKLAGCEASPVRAAALLKER